MTLTPVGMTAWRPIFKGYFNLTVGETLRTWTVMETLISIMGLLGVLAINAVLPVSYTHLDVYKRQG